MQLHRSTSKQDVLDYLIQEAEGAGDLTLHVDSLPSFLDTSLAVTIFLNQLKGYPRKLIWHITSTDIFDILASSKLSIDSIHFDPPRESSNIHDITEAIEHTLVAGQPKSDHILKTDLSKFAPTNIFRPKPVPQVIATTRINTATVTPSTPTESNQFVFTQAPLDEQNSGYQPLVVMHRGEVMSLDNSPTATPQTAPDIGLDSWLTNIEKAKESIKSSKQKQSHFSFDPASSLRNAFAESSTKAHKKHSNLLFWVGRATLAGVAAVLVGAVWFGLSGVLSSPNVYTIKVKQERKEQDVSLTVSTADAKLLVSEQRFESTLATTGKGQGGQKATGTVALINEKNGSIFVNNAGFYLQKGSVTYTVTNNDSLPATLEIPANTSGNQFTFGITANIEGLTTGVGVGERMVVRNLAGALINDGLYGRVETEIKQPKVGNFVEATDIAALTKTNEVKNTAKVTEKLNTLTADQLSLASLSKTDTIKNSPSVNAGDTADSVTLISDFKNTITYFEKAVLLKALSSQLSTDRIESMILVNAKSVDTGYTLTLKTAYYLQKEFSSEQALEVIKVSESLDNTTNTLKTKYPSIQSIDQQKGFSIFPVAPTLRIETTN